MNLLDQAWQFATLHHVTINHQYYGVRPYTHHLQDVLDNLRKFLLNPPEEEEEAACVLHDTVEDCPEVKLRDIEESFGEYVALLVGAVTSEPGENRKVRNALTYPKLRKAGTVAVGIKLADRIANVSYSLSKGNKMSKMYKEEYPDFRHALIDSSTARNNLLWLELDRLMGFYAN